MNLVIIKALFWTPRNLIIIAMAWSLSLMIGKIIPDAWRTPYRKHVSPLLLLVVCSASVWVSGLLPEIADGAVELAPGTGLAGDETGYRIALGFILSVMAYAFPVILMWALEKSAPPAVAKQIRRILL